VQTLTKSPDRKKLVLTSKGNQNCAKTLWQGSQEKKPFARKMQTPLKRSEGKGEHKLSQGGVFGWGSAVPVRSGAKEKKRGVFKSSEKSPEGSTGAS